MLELVGWRVLSLTRLGGFGEVSGGRVDPNGDSDPEEGPRESEEEDFYRRGVYGGVTGPLSPCYIFHLMGMDGGGRWMY